MKGGGEITKETLLQQGNRGWQRKCKRDGHRWLLEAGNIGGPRWVMKCRVCDAVREMTDDEIKVMPKKCLEEAWAPQQEMPTT